MKELLSKANKLIEVKKIIALMVISVFCFMSATGKIQADQFTTVSIMIVSFYFGQSTVKGVSNNG